MESTDNKDIRPDWTDQRLDLCKPDSFVIVVRPKMGLTDILTTEEYYRLQPKLQIVQDMAARMAANMLKGTLKYIKDDWDLDTWLRYLEDDAADTMNYIGLIKCLRKKELETKKVNWQEGRDAKHST